MINSELFDLHAENAKLREENEMLRKLVKEQKTTSYLQRRAGRVASMNLEYTDKSIKPENVMPIQLVDYNIQLRNPCKEIALPERPLENDMAGFVGMPNNEETRENIKAILSKFIAGLRWS